MTERSVDFRDAIAEDSNLFLSSWLKSFRQSEFARDMKNPVYFSGHEKLIKKALSRSNTICAVNPEDHAHVFGWISFEQLSPYSILHYLYVKEKFRGFGIGRKLFGFIQRRPFIYTHQTPQFDRFKDGGFYSVYHFLGE